MEQRFGHFWLKTAVISVGLLTKEDALQCQESKKEIYLIACF